MTDQTLDSLTATLDAIRESAADPSAVADLAPAQTETTASPSAPASPPSPEVSAMTDATGARFDPAIHATGADGKPSITKAGKFRARRKSAASRVADVAGQKSAAISTEEQRKQSRLVGYQAADTMVAMAAMLGGQDWIPAGYSPSPEVNEYETLRKAFADVAEVEGWNISPKKFLIGVILSYAAPRLLGSEETHKRLGIFARMVKPRIAAMVGWLRGFRKGKNAAQSDSRNVGKRENNASQTDMPEGKTSGAGDPGTGPATR